MSRQTQDRICRLCTREVSDAIDLYSGDSVERGVADRMAGILEIPVEQDDQLSSYVCQLCNARFGQLVRSLEVHRLQARKSHEKLAKNAGIMLPDVEDNTSPQVEDARNPKRDQLVEAADMTSVDLGSLLSDLMAAKKRMREKVAPKERKIVTDDIKDLMNLLSGVKDWFIFGTFLGIPTTRLHDIEHNYPGEQNLQRRLTEVVTAWIDACPEGATWPNLVEALTEMGRRKNAKQVAEKRGIIVPGVFDEGCLWNALKSLIPIHEGGSDLVTLLDETEQLRKDVKTKDALLVQSEEQLDEVNLQKTELEEKYTDTLQQLEEQKEQIEAVRNKAQKDLRVKEAELRRLRANRADKETIENMEIEIMYLKKKVEQQKSKERDLVKQMVELQGKLEANDISKLEWIAKNLENELDGVRPKFEVERSKMMNNIYKLLSYVKIPDDLMEGEEGEHEGSPEPEIVAAADLGEGEEEKEEVVEETLQETTPDPEPTDLVSLLSSLKTPTGEVDNLFGDKPFVEGDLDWALSLFEGVSPFLLSQILNLPMERWMAIEAGDLEDEGKQRGGVLGQWGKRGSAAMWSVLVEALVELGLKGRAQTACIEKGVPLPDVNDDGPLWHSMRKTLSKGNEEVQRLLGETEGVRLEVKRKDEMMCISETELEQTRTESELIKANLSKAKKDLAKEIAQCNSLETQISQKSIDFETAQTELDLFGAMSDEQGKECGELELAIGSMKEQHKGHMATIQSLWNEKEKQREEDESHSSVLAPLDAQTSQMKEEFSEERRMLVDKLEVMYEIYTGRDKDESLGQLRKRGSAITKKPETKPVRPPPPAPKPRPQPLPHRIPVSPPPTPPTPGGYRTTSQTLLPSNDPVLPTGYGIMDLFHPNNTFALLPASDLVGRPLVVSGGILTSTTLKGRGALTQECLLKAEIAAPWTIALTVPNRGRIVVDDRGQITIKKLAYQTGDPAFEFIVRPYENKRVTLQSRKFANSFLSVNQDAAVSVREMPPDSSEVQFAVHVQRFNGPYTVQIVGPFGSPSIVNKLKDRSVIQLYSKTTGVYLGLSSGSGGVVGNTNSEHTSTHLVYCDRGLGRVSLKSYTSEILKIKMRFNGMLLCRGEENLDNDFYLKENPDRTVVFESVPNKGRFITVPYGKELLRNFSVNLLVFTKQGKSATLTKYQLN